MSRLLHVRIPTALPWLTLPHRACRPQVDAARAATEASMARQAAALEDDDATGGVIHTVKDAAGKLQDAAAGVYDRVRDAMPASRRNEYEEL